jgi:hypothetical protein
LPSFPKEVVVVVERRGEKVTLDRHGIYCGREYYLDGIHHRPNVLRGTD